LRFIVPAVPDNSCATVVAIGSTFADSVSIWSR
jgi:hypothetical protein